MSDIGSTMSFITLRIYKVLKPCDITKPTEVSFITLRIYKVLKQTWFFLAF